MIKMQSQPGLATALLRMYAIGQALHQGVRDPGHGLRKSSLKGFIVGIKQIRGWRLLTLQLKRRAVVQNLKVQVELVKAAPDFRGASLVSTGMQQLNGFQCGLSGAPDCFATSPPGGAAAFYKINDALGQLFI